MAKVNKSFIRIFISRFILHPWLKVISLILAVMVWFYVNGAINRY